LREDGLQAGEVGGSEHESVSRRDVDEVEVDSRFRDLSSQVSEYAWPIVDLDDDDLALAADCEVRDCQRMLRGLGVWNQYMQFDPISRPDAGRRCEVDASVADCRRDAR
jgi:hypothetical protein